QVVVGALEPGGHVHGRDRGAWRKEVVGEHGQLGGGGIHPLGLGGLLTLADDGPHLQPVVAVDRVRGEHAPALPVHRDHVVVQQGARYHLTSPGAGGDPPERGEDVPGGEEDTEQDEHPPQRGQAGALGRVGSGVRAAGGAHRCLRPFPSSCRCGLAPWCRCGLASQPANEVRSRGNASGPDLTHGGASALQHQPARPSRRRRATTARPPPTRTSSRAPTSRPGCRSAPVSGTSPPSSAPAPLPASSAPAAAELALAVELASAEASEEESAVEAASAAAAAAALASASAWAAAAAEASALADAVLSASAAA